MAEMALPTSSTKRVWKLCVVDSPARRWPDVDEDCDLGAANSAAAYGPGKCSDKCKDAPFCGDRAARTPQVSPSVLLTFL
jgi:hypothetical protein